MTSSLQSRHTKGALRLDSRYAETVCPSDFRLAQSMGECVFHFNTSSDGAIKPPWGRSPARGFSEYLEESPHRLARPSAAKVLGWLATEGCPDEGGKGGEEETPKGENSTSLWRLTRSNPCDRMAQPVVTRLRGKGAVTLTRQLVYPFKLVKDNTCHLC